MIDTSYTVKTPVFEGPLMVLLDLIEKRKFFINEISLASVTDEYLAYIKGLENRKLGDTVAFIVVAATLILVKSKSLLPSISFTEDEQKDINELASRLRIYEIVKDIIPLIKNNFKKDKIRTRIIKKNYTVVFTPDEQITKEEMLASLKRVLQEMPQKNVTPETHIQKVMSIEEMIESLAKRIEEGLKGESFNNLVEKSPFARNTKEHKVFVIVGFLAMLELVKQGIADVLQNETFDSIHISKKENEEYVPDTEYDDIVV